MSTDNSRGLFHWCFHIPIQATSISSSKREISRVAWKGLNSNQARDISNIFSVKERHIADSSEVAYLCNIPGFQSGWLHLSEGGRGAGDVHRKARTGHRGGRRRVDCVGHSGGRFRFRGSERTGDRRQQDGKPPYGQRPFTRLLGSVLPVETRPLGGTFRLSRSQAQSHGERMPAAEEGWPPGRTSLHEGAGGEREPHRQSRATRYVPDTENFLNWKKHFWFREYRMKANFVHQTHDTV